MYTFITHSHQKDHRESGNLDRNITDDKTLRCPSDKKQIKYTEMSKIPRCYQILLNLPNKNQNVNNSMNTINTHINQQNKQNAIHCSRHPNKKIKFFCVKDNTFPCSICIKEHQDNNYHDIENFEINFEEMAGEWNSLRKMIDFEFNGVYYTNY